MSYCPHPTSKRVCEINYEGKCCLECHRYHDCENACLNQPSKRGKEKCNYAGGSQAYKPSKKAMKNRSDE